MLIKLLTGIVDAAGAYFANDLVDWQPDEEAQRLLDRDYAELPADGEADGKRIRRRTPPVVIPTAKPAEAKGAIDRNQLD